MSGLSAGGRADSGGGDARTALDVLTFGEVMVSFRTDGMLVSGAACTAHVAGTEGNVAIGLARLGHSARWIGGLADDALGDFVASTLASEGVDVVRAPAQGRPAGVMLLQRRTADIARVAYVRKDSAASRLTSERVLAAFGPGVRRLHVTGVTPALSASAAEATLAAVQHAASLGVPVSLDVNYRAALWSRQAARAALAEIVPYVDVVIASEDELDLVVPAGLSDPSAPRARAAETEHDTTAPVGLRDPAGPRAGTPETEHDTADTLSPSEQPPGEPTKLPPGEPPDESPGEQALVDWLLQRGCGEVVVKRGARGATLFREGIRLDAPAREVSVVDVVGAGDAFTAGYLSGRLDGLSDADCLERGNVLGAFAVSTRGDWEGLPTRDELDLLTPGGRDVAR